MNLSKIQGILSVALGIVLILVGVMQRNKKKKLLKDGVQVEGEVFDVLGDSSKDSSGRPVIRFVTKEQVLITEQYKISIPFSKKGQKVILVYNADNPKEFIVKEIL